MLKTGEIYEAEITALSSGGEGICRLEQMAVFVPETCAGDRVELRIVSTKPHYARGELLRILSPSADRTEPVCPAYRRCGGCQLMHLSYARQLREKQQFVTDALTRLGHLDLSETECLAPLAAEKPLFYRNKMVFPIGKKADGRIVGGFYSAKSHNIISLSDCALGEPFAAAFLQATVAYCKEYRVPIYDEATHKGLIRRLFVRSGAHSHEIMVVLCANGDRLPQEDALCKKLLAVPTGEYRLCAVILNTNREKNNLVLGLKNRTLWGADAISDSLLGLSFEISPNSFYQVNPKQTEALYSAALDFAALSGSETVLDLYCGIGTISLCAARRAARVIGVEIVPQAIRDAKDNARRNGIRNAEFYTGDAETISARLLEEGLSPDVIFLDPPRKGSDPKTLNAILRMAPERIVYVSCNPATLARDLAILTADGYALRKVRPVDMFPQTTHVETVVLMSRVNR